jgi:hypothetical protein
MLRERLGAARGSARQHHLHAGACEQRLDAQGHVEV